MPTSLLLLTIVFAILAGASVLVAHQRHDGALNAGWQSTWVMVRNTMPLFVFAWVFAGFISVLVSSELGPGKKPTIPASVMISAILFAVLVAASMTIAYGRHDSTLAKGLQSAWSMFREMWLLLVVAWIFAGYIEVLLPTEFIAKWLGKGSGWQGIALACVAGGLTPGGPFVAMPVVAGLYRAGAGEGVLVAYISAWSLYALGRLPFEVTFLGARLTVIRWVSTCIFPPLAGMIARLFFER